MPYAPLNTKCSMLGCHNNKARYGGTCIEHGGKDTLEYKRIDKRLDANRLYASKQWQRTRTLQLSKQPLCVGCLADGIVTSAIDIDHVFPWQRIGKQAFFLNMFQSLCHSCHSSKTSLERKGIFRAYGSPHKDYSIEDYALVQLTLLKG